MKRIILPILMSIGLLLLMPVTAMAGPRNPIPTNIKGTVSLPDNSPAVGASVTINCGPFTFDSSDISTLTTDSNGNYLASLQGFDCPEGSTVNINASLGSFSGSNSGTVNADPENNDSLAVVNVNFVNISNVPEFGIITVAIAVAVTISSLIIIRRREVGVK